jgi:hypothetical protein
MIPRGWMGGLLGFAAATVAVPKLMLAGEAHEQRLLVDSAFTQVMRSCGIETQTQLLFDPGRGFTLCVAKDLWNGMRFARVCSLACSATDDLGFRRFHARGKTIAQQLEKLSSFAIESAWVQTLKCLDGNSMDVPCVLNSVAGVSHNVVQSYLLHHVIALRLACRAGEHGSGGQAEMIHALLLEALAQSYLIDVFSSAHMLVPMDDPFTWLHPLNTQECHDFYDRTGVYVINSRGDVWRSFGDRALRWYGFAFERVSEASATSLLEILNAYYQSVDGASFPAYLEGWRHAWAGHLPRCFPRGAKEFMDGESYYRDESLPTLLLLPMPISAAWSMRLTELDSHKVHLRKHFPQLREDGLHDPDLNGIDETFLYPRSAVLPSMVPDMLASGSLDSLIRYDPAISSVRFVQDRYRKPAFQGGIIRFGFGRGLGKDARPPGGYLGLGLGLLNRLSLELGIGTSLSGQHVTLASVTSSACFELPEDFSRYLWIFNALYLESGFVWGWKSPDKVETWKMGAGIASVTLPVGLTYVGVMIVVKAEVIFLNRPSSGVGLDLIFH